ncbi:hypothetical protein [Fluviispira vulneris]|uniref:hypothetical protein n=1 Tax=Fluviispira vulneris TaxID=2763012 RepID=UPI00164681B1|nr:hypothetical protein [Fluviispira vulneris]
MNNTFKDLHEHSFLSDLFSNLDNFKDDLLNKKSPRLIVNMPPRHLKTRTLALGFPLFLESFKKLKIAVFTHNYPNSCYLKNISLEISEYNEVYYYFIGHEIEKEKFDLIIIDDPFYFYSAYKCEYINNYVSNLLNKNLNKNGGFILVESRYSVNDLTSYLLKNYNDFKLLKYRALDIADQHFSLEHFHRIKNNCRQIFESLYQQEPVCEEK